MSLINHLDKEKPLKFQLNKLDRTFVKNILSKYNKGIFNLSSKINQIRQEKIVNYLNKNYPKYTFILRNNPPNPEIYFMN